MNCLLLASQKNFLKNLEENLIAIEIDKNNNKVTTTIYISINDILIPVLLSSTI